MDTRQGRMAVRRGPQALQWKEQVCAQVGSRAERPRCSGTSRSRPAPSPVPAPGRAEQPGCRLPEGLSAQVPRRREWASGLPWWTVHLSRFSGVPLFPLPFPSLFSLFSFNYLIKKPGHPVESPPKTGFCWLFCLDRAPSPPCVLLGGQQTQTGSSGPPARPQTAPPVPRARLGPCVEVHVPAWHKLTTFSQLSFLL